jgi:hypothetical protein
MKTDYVSLGYGKKTDHYKAGRMTATLSINSAYSKGKSVSLFGIDSKVAYDTVDFWAEKTSKELNIPYRRASYEALMSKIEGVELSEAEQIEIKHNSSHPSLTATALGKLMRNTRYLQTAIVPVYEVLGLERIKVLFAESIAMLEGLEVEKKAEAEVKTDASKTVATTLFEIYKDKGLDMSATINDVETLKHFRDLKAEHESK